MDPWGREEIENYEKVLAQFGIEPISTILKKLPNPNHYFLRNIIFGHRDLISIVQAIRSHRPWAVLTGLMPSGKFHLGHKMVCDQLIYYQKLGGEIFVTIADIEAYLTRNKSIDEMRELALTEYLQNYLALGLDHRKLKIYFQSEGSPEYQVISKFLARRITKNEFSAIYGEMTPEKLISVLTQVADIFYPQMEEHGGPKPVVVPVGVDKDPHIRLTRDLADRTKSEFGFLKPAASYHKHMRGIKGGKMSSSDPSSYIALTDPIKESLKKIDQALTGGRDTAEEQRKLGAVIEKDVVFELLAFHLITEDKKLKKIEEDYRSGKLMSGELKLIAKELLENFLIRHQKAWMASESRARKLLKV